MASAHSAMLRRSVALLAAGVALGAVLSGPSLAGESNKIACKEAGPQAPRDITGGAGINAITFKVAPPADAMHLCDIHFHRNAEHRASGYTELAGEGEHKGFVCNGTKRRPAHSEGHGEGHGNEHGSAHGHGCSGIAAGDTVEVHWVFTTCNVKPAPTLGSCFTETCKDPQLRVEARVFTLTDEEGADFASLSDYSSGRVGVPPATEPVQYLGSTTGSSYNDGTCSPFKVTWNVSSACQPLKIGTINNWCGKDHNVFAEDHAHGVRELVTNPELLSPIE